MDPGAAIAELSAKLLAERQAREALEVRVAALEAARQGPAEVMTVKEAAKYLRMSVRSIRRLVADRSIPFDRVGPGKRLLRFQRSKLDEWRKRGGRKPGTPRLHSRPHAPGVTPRFSDNNVLTDTPVRGTLPPDRAGKGVTRCPEAGSEAGRP